MRLRPIPDRRILFTSIDQVNSSNSERISQLMCNYGRKARQTGANKWERPRRSLGLRDEPLLPAPFESRRMTEASVRRSPGTARAVPTGLRPTSRRHPRDCAFRPPEVARALIRPGDRVSSYGLAQRPRPVLQSALGRRRHRPAIECRLNSRRTTITPAERFGMPRRSYSAKIALVRRLRILSTRLPSQWKSKWSPWIGIAIRSGQKIATHSPPRQRTLR